MKTPELDATKPTTDELFETDVQEVWFAGCHTSEFHHNRGFLAWLIDVGQMLVEVQHRTQWNIPSLIFLFDG